MEPSKSIQITITDNNGNEFTKTLEGDDLGVWATAFFRLRGLYEDASSTFPIHEWAGKIGEFIDERRLNAKNS